MKRKIIILGVLFSLIIILGIIFGLKQFNSKNYVNVVEYTVFSGQILKQEKQIFNSGCLVGDQVYLSLSQNYKYNNEFQKSLNTLKSILDCYPKAYNIVSLKSLLLINNIGDVYENWGYFLKEKGDINYKVKYQKALDSYEKILKVFSKTKEFNEDMKKEYEGKIKRIKEMMK